MDLLHEPAAFRAACDAARARGERVGLVPTMGALHAGHMSLVREAARRSDHVAVTIFVNPTQFGPNEDLARYPRTLDADAALCRDAGVATVFAPPADAMYPRGEETRVKVGATAAPLCGVFRPTHFEGVATIVTKLFALAGPCCAVFGRKDYQQWRVIERFTADLFLPIEIVGAPIVRESDGLALSSRNAYLSPADRRRALALVRGLRAAAAAFAAGTRDAEALRAAARGVVEQGVDRIDYVEVADPHTVAPLEGTVGERALVAIAAHVGKTRLIDNCVLGEDSLPAEAAHG
jgi:pantoate--beta-alanine ligase